MHTPVIPEQNGQEEEMKPAGLVTPKLVDITMRWLPIQEYEEEGKRETSHKRTGKEG